MPAVSVKPAVNAITLSARPDLTLTARQQRQHDPDFLARCDIAALVGQLPLRWPTPPQVPASPKPRYRSDYQPPDPARVQQLDEAAWESISLFDLLLLLVDFSGLRPVLASKLYRTSARGRIPFDPISCFLLFGWQLVNCWKRLEVLRQLAKPRNADYREAFGFRSGVYPSESGYRYFLTVLGQKPLGELIRQSMELVRATGAIPAEVLAQATVPTRSARRPSYSNRPSRSMPGCTWRLPSADLRESRWPGGSATRLSPDLPLSQPRRASLWPNRRRGRHL